MHLPIRLIWKLLLINTLSLAIVLVSVAIAVHVLAAMYFSTLMEKYNVSPNDAHSMFLQAVNQYLLVASLFGFLVATALSLWLDYKVVSPISKITSSARLIASGNYSQRVETRACGEIEELSKAFNDLAENLERGERLRKDFIVDVAHELRTPLTNIRGYMEGLRDSVIKPKKEVFESIHEETLRLVDLVEELLRLARADTAQSSLRFVEVNLASLIRQTLERFQPRLNEKRLSSSLEFAAMVTIDADPDRLTQVFTNLFENAVRYSPLGGDIKVRLNLSLEVVRVTIVNDCDESPADTISIFERFQRGETSRSRRYGGAGLGLAIVKELVHAHGGSVGSRFQDHKAEIWLELPRKRSSKM